MSQHLTVLAPPPQRTRRWMWRFPGSLHLLIKEAHGTARRSSGCCSQRPRDARRRISLWNRLLGGDCFSVSPGTGSERDELAFGQRSLYLGPRVPTTRGRQEKRKGPGATRCHISLRKRPELSRTDGFPREPEADGKEQVMGLRDHCHARFMP